MANCCSTFMKLVFLVIAALIGITGVLLTYVATDKTLNIPLDKFDNNTKAKDSLKDFISCKDIADEKFANSATQFSNLTEDNQDIVKGMLTTQCMEPVQLPAGVIFNTAATLSMFSLLSGIVAGCRDVKGNLYSYTIVSSTSIALMITSIAWMASISAGPMKNFAPCDMFDQETVEVLEKDFNFQCVNFKDSFEADVDVATSWMSSVAVFYAGCILSVLSMLMFMVMNSCASQGGSLQRDQTDQYGRMPDGGKTAGRY